MEEITRLVARGSVKTYRTFEETVMICNPTAYNKPVLVDRPFNRD